MSNRFVGAGLLLAMASCHYVLRPGELQPATANIPPEQRVAAWHRAINVFLDQGYVPTVLNEAACYVSGKRRDDLDYGTLAGSTAQVVISPEGLVRVHTSGAGTYSSENALAADVTKMQSLLLQGIIAPEAPVPTRARR